MAREIRCPECGHVVESYFDHIDIDCEHDMTEQEIADLRRDGPASDVADKLSRGLRAWNMAAIDQNG